MSDADTHDVPRYQRPHDRDPAALRHDPGLPQGDLQAPGGGRPRDRHRARARPGRLAGVGLGDAEEARGARPARARALPRRAPDPGRREGRARGDPPPPAARAVPRPHARPERRGRPRRGRPARARDLRGARGSGSTRRSAIPTHDPHGDPIPDANLEWPAAERPVGGGADRGATLWANREVLPEPELRRRAA